MLTPSKPFRRSFVVRVFHPAFVTNVRPFHDSYRAIVFPCNSRRTRKPLPSCPMTRTWVFPLLKGREPWKACTACCVIFRIFIEVRLTKQKGTRMPLPIVSVWFHVIPPVFRGGSYVCCMCVVSSCAFAFVQPCGHRAASNALHACRVCCLLCLLTCWPSGLWFGNSFSFDRPTFAAPCLAVRVWGWG